MRSSSLRAAVGGALALSVALAVGPPAVAAPAPSAASSAAAAPAALGALRAADDFYDPPAVVDGAPGTVLRAEAGRFFLDPLRLVQADARVQRLMYVSTDADGEPEAVTGTLITPRAAWRGPGTRPLITYAVGTQGMADSCAPSRQLAAGSEYEGLFIKGLLLRGYQVVVTDYQGLGTPGGHPYVNAPVLGRNVLDAARAARQAPSDATPASAPVLVAGYSEGGNAAAGALEQLDSYAPELPVAAGYAGAVPADLTAVAGNLDGGLYAAFLLYAVRGLDVAYPGLALPDLLNDRGRRALADVEAGCLFDSLPRFAFTRSSALTASGRPVTDFLSRPDIAAALGQVRLGSTAPSVPVLVAHSRLDDVVPYGQGRAMAREWCSGGASVRFRTGLAPTHVGGAVESYAAAYAFFEARVQGVRAPSNCGWF